jgi:hypothetical protein
MRERVRLLTGKLTVTSESGQGTTVLAWVPLKEVQHHQARADFIG